MILEYLIETRRQRPRSSMLLYHSHGRINATRQSTASSTLSPTESSLQNITHSLKDTQHISPLFFLNPKSADLQTKALLQQDPYFFYGSLQDQRLLIDLLDLKEAPHLRPAYIEGYQCKLWGHYPALLFGGLGDTVTGTVYEVPTVEDAEKLVAYEGPSYTTTACLIRYADCHAPIQAEGYAFLFVGNMRDLSEGSFDFKRWLERRALGRND
ncbi:hypothetical protein PDIDSM_6779 [Penicillium digitatum]|nr:hypothetical protein PDIDSM_6779 [Penicillium digitatum]